MLKSYYQKGRLEAGCDEAGRGCLAGPVVAAAVILPVGFENEILDDSKTLSPEQRTALREVIEKEALAHAVAFVPPQKIDEINILQASLLAMRQAIKQLQQHPDHLLIDGNHFVPDEKIPHTCIVGGDGQYLSIAAASILAKTYRDEYMIELHGHFPHYCWKSNKGYPTPAHRAAIVEHGPSPHHRQSFRLYPLPEQGKLFG